MIRALWIKDLDKQGINPEDLVLLDTSAISFLCLCRSNYEKLLKNHPSDYFIRSQWCLARSIVEGELKNGAVTPVVFEELYGISQKKPFDKKVLLECLRKIKEDSKCQLYNIFIPKTEYEKFPYLGEVLKEGKGEISIAINQ